jgi:hypothetical protein
MTQPRLSIHDEADLRSLLSKTYAISPAQEIRTRLRRDETRRAWDALCAAGQWYLDMIDQEAERCRTT